MRNLRTLLLIWNISTFILLFGVAILLGSKMEMEIGRVMEIYLLLILSYLLFCVLSDIILWALKLTNKIKTNYSISRGMNPDGYYLKKNYSDSSTKYTAYCINYKTHIYQSHYYTDLWVLIPFFSIFGFIVEEDYNNEIEFSVKNSENVIYISIKTIVDRFKSKSINAIVFEDKFIKENTYIVKVMEVNEFTPELFLQKINDLVIQYESEFRKKYSSKMETGLNLKQINKFTTLTYNT